MCRQAYGLGEAIHSGHLLHIESMKAISGARFSLQMGVQHGQSLETILKTVLQVTNPVVVDCAEVSGATGETHPTAWRLVLFESYTANPINLKRFPEVHARLRAEQVICFYHKEAEAYLEYRDDMGNEPMFRASSRVAIKARKKASWMWKIESLSLFGAAGAVECSDSRQYRIKHIITNKYLSQNGDRLEMTTDYLAPGAEFIFRQFESTPQNKWVLNQGLVYIQTSSGAALQQDADAKLRIIGHRIRIEENNDPRRETPVHLRMIEGLSERDALLVIPVLPESFKSVVQIRHCLLVISDFADRLEAIPKHHTSMRVLLQDVREGQHAATTKKPFDHNISMNAKQDQVLALSNSEGMEWQATEIDSVSPYAKAFLDLHSPSVTSPSRETQFEGVPRDLVPESNQVLDLTERCSLPC